MKIEAILDELRKRKNETSMTS